MTLIYTLLFFLGLIIFHEFGHYISARVMNVRVVKVGFSVVPIPHPYVMVENLSSNLQRRIFLLAGIGMTLLLLSTSYLTGWLALSFVRLAFTIELLIETNPFYSDLTLINLDLHKQRILNDLVYQKKMSVTQMIHANDYIFSSKWYLHVIGWLLLVHLLISEKLILNL